MISAVVVPAPITRVWERLAAIGEHAEWMADAESIEFIGDRTSGIGTRIRVRTRVGPLRIDDEIEFTSWRPSSEMAVEHLGRVRGTGEFLLEETGGGTLVTWVEALEFPWYFGGRLGLAVARPALRRMFESNLHNFAAWAVDVD